MPGDIDGDGQVGLAEAIYALQAMALVTPDPMGDYVVFAWNDLGMHCLNPTYDTAVILPPYNTVWAQVVGRGAKPQIAIEGLSVAYQVLNNTYSYGKREYGQFWDYVQPLFGTALANDRGLNLADPEINNSLAGNMVLKGDHFQVDGIPVTPVNDAGTWNPYQMGAITVKNVAGGTVARTRATVPASDEINCGNCHGADPFADILQNHDTLHPTTLVSAKPVLCAGCHGSPHAMPPSSLDADNYQAVQYQNGAKTIGSCGVCHEGSRGEDDEIEEFLEKHGGPDPEKPTACNVCHTAIASADTTL